jgi:DNA-directed RNA polymerase subunit RPC12/RpoP
MITSNKAVHVTVTCDFCGTKNELTITEIHATQPIKCSTCGGLLGTVADLMDEEAREDIASVSKRAGTFGR